ncbi:SAV_915 family protein [Kitasatospora sp. NBC_01266]|uniref:SAV_915 family protein n=1 Tax=Kitasatospora sp. NBC_01266 TaxID=2903572 RepID=UPI002E3109E1|nr:SAV_915 family protein [Kitasatospora sp. NBC_01266]
MTSADPGPRELAERAAALYVPVRTGRAGHTLRLFRRRDGRRCAIAFSCPEQLTALLGPAHQFVRLSEPALRALTEPLRAALVLDPRLISQPITAPPPAHPAPVPSQR